MRLLDRYLLRELLGMFGICLGGLLVAVIAFDLISGLNRFQENHLQLRDVIELYIVQLPEILVLILPITLLVALLYVLTNHARHHELTAMRAAGVSLWRICMPYFAIGILLSIVVFALNELWVPDSAAKELDIMNRHNPRNSAADVTVQSNLGFYNGRDARNWIIGVYDFRSDTMGNPQVTWAEQGTNWHLLARHAERINGTWIFTGDNASPYGVSLYESDATTGFQMQRWLDTNRLAMPQFRETPRQFVNEARFNRRMEKLTAESADVPISELYDYARVHTDLSLKQRYWLYTQMHGRIAEPWSCLVVVLIAIPLGAASGRRNIFMGVAGAIIICFIYFVLLRLGLALGTGGYVPAWIAAWLPNAAFGIAGFWMILRVR